MYDFQPLAIDGIRLFKIHPKLRDGYIACTLNQYHDCIPPYDSLSYYWGDPRPTRKIYVNDSLVDTHETLWEFLDQMQRSQETENWIWTDFLCLNQRNNEEMGQQVPRMGQIYSQAKTTISWLGCSRSSWASSPHDLSLTSPDLEEDLRLIAEKAAAKGAAVQSFFARPALLRWTRVAELLSRPDESFSPDEVKSGQKDDYGNLPKPIKEVVQLSQGHMIQPILNTLSVPYWTRVWIAQEVALAKEVTLMFGRISMDFNNFLLTYKAYFYYMLLKAPRECINLRVPIEARAAVHDNNVSFRQIVRWAHDCDASRPVDRIYGLLGLLARCGDGINNTLPSSLTGTIDYTRDVREIYWDIAFTSPLSIDSIAKNENDYIKVTERWVDILSILAQVLACPFTPESLRYAYNERMTPLSRTKACLALSLIDVCRETVIIDSSILIKEANAFSLESSISSLDSSRSSLGSSRSWPTKRSAQCLWSNPSDNLKKKTLQFQRLLGSLLLETAECGGIDEKDEYQAALIGLTMSKWERCTGEWNCVSNQSILDSSRSAPGVGVDFGLECSIGPAPSQLPCSLLSTRSSSWPGQVPHQCPTPDRYLEIRRQWQGATWKLSLKDLRLQGSYWRGTLNIKY